jgi:uncharacterized membrane protein/glutaredoxin
MPNAPAIRAAALLGAASGLRSATPFGVLALRGRLGDGRLRTAALAAAAGELVADKLPVTPSRTSPPALGGRLVSGAAAGGLLGGAGAAAIGAGCAGLAAFAGERTRAALGRRSGVTDPLVALVEDALAVGLAVAATRRLAGGAAPRPCVCPARDRADPLAMIELYQAEWCPYSSRVRQRLTELGVSFLARQVPPEPADREELRRRTGSDEIPALIDDGEVVPGDADALIAYLDRTRDERAGAEEHRRQAELHDRAA